MVGMFLLIKAIVGLVGKQVGLCVALVGELGLVGDPLDIAIDIK